MKTHIIKGLSILLIIFFTSFAGFGYNNPQLETDTLISNDSLNLAILEMDFLSNQFIRASVKHYPLCSTCDLDSLPFLWTYLPPMDFGEMQFYYSLNNQLLFGATLVWMGEGAIYYPDSFAPSSSFPLSAEITPLPSNAQYLYWPIFPSMGGFPYFKAKSDTMWNAVSNLQLVHDFAAGSHMRVGFLGYAPSQGIFNPVPARWLIFLYRGSTVTSIASVVPGEAEIKIFPNPTSQQLNIQLKNCNTKNLRFSVFDLSGRKCLEKSLNNSFSQTIDIQQLESGIYQYQIEGSGFLKKDRFVKN